MTRKELYEKWCNDSYKVKKYQKPGVYCIKINDQIVYIGKSSDMLRRLVEHVFDIEEGTSSNKYKVLHEAHNKEEYIVGFDVLYKSRKRLPDRIKKDIGEAEARFINKYKPVLNYQIPIVGDYTHYTINKQAKTITFTEIAERSKNQEGD